eukprot:2330178-Amphidinium_carterae.1
MMWELCASSVRFGGSQVMGLLGLGEDTLSFGKFYETPDPKMWKNGAWGVGGFFWPACVEGAGGLCPFLGGQ